MTNQIFVEIHSIKHLVVNRFADVPFGYRGHTKIVHENILCYFGDKQTVRRIVCKNLQEVPSNYTGGAWLEEETAWCVFKNGKLHGEDGEVAWSVNTPKTMFSVMYLNGLKHSNRFPAVFYATRGSVLQQEYWVDGVQYSEEHWKKNFFTESKEDKFFGFQPKFKKENQVPTGFTGTCLIEGSYVPSHCDYVNKKLHNLSGPAKRFFGGGCEYYINDVLYSKHEWQNHPDVIDYKLKIIEDIC